MTDPSCEGDSQHHIHVPQEDLPDGVLRCACQLNLADHREDEPLHLVVIPKPNKLSNTLRTASFGARTARQIRVVRQAPSSKEWLPSVHGGKDVDEDAGNPLPNSRNLRKCRSRRRIHASTSLLSKRCRRTNAGG